MRVTPQQLSFTASAGTQCSPTRQSISTRLRRGPGQSRSSSSQSRVLDAVPDVVMTSGSRLRPAWIFGLYWTVLGDYKICSTGRQKAFLFPRQVGYFFRLL